MLFNSFVFIFAFLPTTVVGYYLLSRAKSYLWSRSWILVCSLVFYGWWNPKYVVLILGSMIINYLIGSRISLSTDRKKQLLVLGIVFNLSVLFYYKYVDFFINNLNLATGSSIPLLHVILPLGISFFTFQQLAYLVDSYHGFTKEYNFVNYGVFVSFFPQLIAGPIVHHKEMMPQFQDRSIGKLNYFNMTKGLYIFLMGLCKKIIIADTFGVIANSGYAHPLALSTVQAWVTSLSYSFQLYFDFSGYSDMAIGLGLMFNIILPINFNSPYKSLNVQEFWRKWHITLSRFLRDYLYIPLGGNRLGEGRTFINLIITFLLGGIWHGAGWTFVFWGFLHGVALVVQRMFSKLKLKVPDYLSLVITFLFVNVTWVFFRAKNWDDAISLLKAMVGLGHSPENTVLINSYFDLPIWIIGVLLLFYKNTNELADRFQLNWKHFAAIVFMFAAAMVFLNSSISQDFLYFDF